jgi:hypothetical protein
MFRSLRNYLNPFAHLGKRSYPLLFPFVTTIVLYIAGDLFGKMLWGQSQLRANTMIFLTFALVIYFAFRSAIKGGLIVTALFVLYIIYYIYVAKATTGEKEMAVITASILAFFYLLISLKRKKPEGGQKLVKKNCGQFWNRCRSG